MYVYIESERSRDEKGKLHILYTVGFYSPDGKWHSESDHDSTESAANRVAFLNGSTVVEKHDSDVNDVNFVTSYPYAITISDGHEEECLFFKSKPIASKVFEILKQYESDIHLYHYSKDYGYEVIDSFFLDLE